MDRAVGLSRKRVLITGATRGLGREMAEGLAAEGAEVIVVSRRQDACDITVRELVDKYGVRAHGRECHVGSWSAVTALVEDVYTSIGPLDVLVNNAGISPLYDSLENVSEELWDKTFAVNLKGAFRLTAMVGTRMAGGAGGSIINISSVASLKPSPTWLPYSAAKAALNNMTEGFAHAFGPTVRVNAIVCGAFLTDISASWDEEETDRRMSATTALKRAADPTEIVGTVLYLASEQSSYTTGALIRVDGGRT